MDMDKINEDNYPYQIAKCIECEKIILGDAEQWPPKDMTCCATCEKLWCRDCCERSTPDICLNCLSWHCDDCPCFK